MKPITTVELIASLVQFDSCSIANAVDSLGLRMPNEGFSGSGVSCRTENLPPMAGIAVTLKVRSSDPSMKPAFYLDRTDWWEALGESPVPRVLVIEDVDSKPGRGALVGPVHACIIKALGFVGVITSGAVRGTEKLRELGVCAFSGNVSPSHAFSHVVEFGGAVEIAGARIENGDIVHGDRDGFVVIPAAAAPSIAEIAARFVSRESDICRFCSSSGFSAATLRTAIAPDKSRR